MDSNKSKIHSGQETPVTQKDPTVRNDPVFPVLREGSPIASQPFGRLERYQIKTLVGRGGMGDVYLAFDQNLQRNVALKFPRMDSAGNPQLIEQFLHEARLAAQLNHPNLVKIYEVDVWGEACFIASEWCEGGDLAKWLLAHPGPQDPKWSARMIGAIARGIAYCHQQNIVHLDIKPANIILASGTQLANGALKGDGGTEQELLRPMLTDFGVARVIEEGRTMTHTSMLMGTPMYMAPEQADSNRLTIGPKSDIFSLGIVLYELLYGVRPFEAETAFAIIDRIRGGQAVVFPQSPRVPTELRTICERCLQHSPKDRYPSADALAEDLDRFLRSEPIHARPITWRLRVWRWLERPERVVQAGLTGLAIQMLFLVDFGVILLLRTLGLMTYIQTDERTLVVQLFLLAAIFHIPCIVFAILLIRSKVWALIPGLILTSMTLAALLHGLITGSSTISAYDGQPVAMFLVYTIFSIAIAIQIAACLASIPAARIIWSKR